MCSFLCCLLVLGSVTSLSLSLSLSLSFSLRFVLEVRSMPIGVSMSVSTQYAYTRMGCMVGSYKVCLRSIRMDMAYMLEYKSQIYI